MEAPQGKGSALSRDQQKPGEAGMGWGGGGADRQALSPQVQGAGQGLVPRPW